LDGDGLLRCRVDGADQPSMPSTRGLQMAVFLERSGRYALRAWIVVLVYFGLLERLSVKGTGKRMSATTGASQGEKYRARPAEKPWAAVCCDLCGEERVEGESQVAS
jgi:hypothetical protein